MPYTVLLPSDDEITDYENNFNYHVLCSLLRLKFIEKFRHVVPQCIDYPYMKEAAQKFNYHVIQLVGESENSSDGMIEIMKDLHNIYVPSSPGEHPDVLHKIELAGDTITNERAFGVQTDMMNSHSSFDKLAVFNHRSGGLHLIMNLTMVNST